MTSTQISKIMDIENRYKSISERQVQAFNNLGEYAKLFRNIDSSYEGLKMDLKKLNLDSKALDEVNRNIIKQRSRLKPFILQFELMEKLK